LRYVIYGAGGVGGVIGGRLFQHGHEVILVARGDHLAAIREHGLRLQSPAEDVVLPVLAVGHPSEIQFEKSDVVFLAMKTQDTAAALADLLDAAGPDVPVVCAQNGVENERLALRYFGNVYAMVVMLPASHLEPGVVQGAGEPFSGLLDLGRYPVGIDELSRRIASALSGSGFSSFPLENIMRWKYTKLLMNVANSLQAACEPGADIRDIRRMLREEAAACYRAAGIDWASDEEDASRREGNLRIGQIAGQRRAGGSSWQSLARATGSIEADFLNGEIALLGRLHGVPTPINSAMQRIANRLARDKRPPGSMSEEELRAELGLIATPG
jgi:2-dehydropantoate 2-reductase